MMIQYWVLTQKKSANIVRSSKGVPKLIVRPPNAEGFSRGVRRVLRHVQDLATSLWNKNYLCSSVQLEEATQNTCRSIVTRCFVGSIIAPPSATKIGNTDSYECIGGKN